MSNLLYVTTVYLWYYVPSVMFPYYYVPLSLIRVSKPKNKPCILQDTVHITRFALITSNSLSRSACKNHLQHTKFQTMHLSQLLYSTKKKQKVAATGSERTGWGFSSQPLNIQGVVWSGKENHHKEMDRKRSHKWTIKSLLWIGLPNKNIKSHQILHLSLVDTCDISI